MTINDHLTPKHTPGPWRVLGPQPYGSGGIIMAGESGIGSVFAAENWEANAKLIVASTDMIEAIQLLLTSHDNGDIQGEARGWVALRKARKDAAA